MPAHSRIIFIGLCLLIMGVLGLLYESSPHNVLQNILGTAFFLTGALYFTVYFLENEQKWWAVLPAGLLFTVAVTLLCRAYSLINPKLLHVVLYSGLSLSLHLLWKFRPDRSRLLWLRLLSAISAALAVVIYGRFMRLLDTWSIVALLLVALGTWLILGKKFHSEDK